MTLRYAATRQLIKMRLLGAVPRSRLTKAAVTTASVAPTTAPVVPNSSIGY